MSPALAGRALASETEATPVKPFEFDEATVSDLQARMKSGEISARSLTQAYLDRMIEIDKSGPAINSVIEVNP
jgi:amidase